MNQKTAVILAAGLVVSALVWTDHTAPFAAAQSAPSPFEDAAPAQGVDVMLTMPILESQGWFIHAYRGRVRACSVDGASVVGERTAPRCSDWSG